MPDPMHQRAITPDFNTVVIEGKHVVDLPPSDAVVFAANRLNCCGVIVPVDAYEVVSEHGCAPGACPASPQQAALFVRSTWGCLRMTRANLTEVQPIRALGSGPVGRGLSSGGGAGWTTVPQFGQSVNRLVVPAFATSRLNVAASASFLK